MLSAIQTGLIRKNLLLKKNLHLSNRQNEYFCCFCFETEKKKKEHKKKINNRPYIKDGFGVGFGLHHFFVFIVFFSIIHFFTILQWLM